MAEKIPTRIPKTYVEFLRRKDSLKIGSCEKINEVNQLYAREPEFAITRHEFIKKCIAENICPLPLQKSLYRSNSSEKSKYFKKVPQSSQFLMINPETAYERRTQQIYASIQFRNYLKQQKDNLLKRRSKLEYSHCCKNIESEMYKNSELNLKFLQQSIRPY